ncbi:GNAT family N-acetyltransferase [Actinokineospora terrae]|uniref:L-amino acid N-acyltransferase YncA n=1 Tax=Actinokineospora terrae TaxID=155974 RepID=A0A1H9KBJ4_9PSEU|nr:GNAT family N-acetyltransferase [Actinokineospora terrae]SEQ96576.1 L-amino acid N-acyltransferase YncA [Actinokineospora terrae]
MNEIRPARAGDGAAIGEVHAASWGTVYAPLFPAGFAAEGVRSRLERWHARIAEGVGELLVAERDGRVLAFSHTVPSETRDGYREILSFYGHPDGWGTGVARDLMAETVRGLARVHLWTLRDTAQSRRFYTKCGFVETGATQTRDFGDGNPLPQVEYALVTG